MRRLLYIPVIHDEADLGSAGPDLEQKTTRLSGKSRWQAHRQVVGGFWDAVESYLNSFNAHLLRVYQDGLAADGQIGRRIIEEAAKRGSRNYHLVRDLLRRGAEIRITESLDLLLREYDIAQEYTNKDPKGETPPHTQRALLEKEDLTKQRDRFIAGSIDATLEEGEIGVLFIGAFHDVLSFLPADVSVTFVKDPKALRAYFTLLFSSQHDDEFEMLGQYITSRVRNN